MHRSPAALDRNSIVRGESGNQLQISSKDRWAGDLGEMIRRVLTQDLASRLPAGMVIAPQSPAPSDARGLVVDILTFQPQATGEVVLDADWTLLEGMQSNPVLRPSAHLTAPAAGSAQGEAAAMSALLGQLADSMAAVDRRYTAERAALTGAIPLECARRRADRLLEPAHAEADEGISHGKCLLAPICAVRGDEALRAWPNRFARCAYSLDVCTGITADLHRHPRNSSFRAPRRAASEARRLCAR